MALNKGIWDPTLRGTNIKGTNLTSLSFYKEQDALRLAKGAFAVYPGWFLQAQVLLERAGLWRERRTKTKQDFFRRAYWSQPGSLKLLGFGVM